MGNKQTAAPPSALPSLSLPVPIELSASKAAGGLFSEAAGQQLTESLQKRGYAVLSLDPSDLTTVAAARDAASAFFAQPLDTKRGSSDRDEKNRGYVGPGTFREFFKMRKDEPASAWPDVAPDLQPSYCSAFDVLHRVSWEAYKTLHSLLPKPIYEDKDLVEIEECVATRASLSVIHYYALDPATMTSEAKSGEFMGDEPGSPEYFEENGLHAVCGTHKDTGIFTLIACAPSPGLQVFDTLLNKWVSVEEEMAPEAARGRGIFFLIMGEKASLFLSKDYVATSHRVMVPEKTERYSVLFFQDTTKL